MFAALATTWTSQISIFMALNPKTMHTWAMVIGSRYLEGLGSVGALGILWLRAGSSGLPLKTLHLMYGASPPWGPLGI